MAAQVLDQMWDGWMPRLSASYQKTTDLLDTGKPAEARDEFRRHFLQTVKQLYSEAPQTYPTRFSRIQDWCSWSKNLYILSIRTDKALSCNDTAEASRLLVSLRQHFYALHRETETQTANDLILAFRTAAASDAPPVAEMKTLRASLQTAKPPRKGQTDAAAFAAARDTWARQVDAIFADGKVDPPELPQLRTATDAFYRAFGMDFD